jgi:hypothetical protein
MKRKTLLALALGASLVPGVAIAQSESPAPSPAEMTSATDQPLGTDTMDVCLAISGPVVELTPEDLNQGIIDGVFVIVAMSSGCEPGMQPSQSPTTDDEQGLEGEGLDALELPEEFESEEPSASPEA